MKTFASVILSVMMVFLGVSAQAQGPNSGNSGGVDGVEALGPSLISPTLSTTSLGGGNYQYTISFVNKDTSPIWDFLVYTDCKTTFESPGGFQHCNDLSIPGSVSSCYNARNINPNVTDCLAFYDGWSYPPSSGLGIGKTCTVSFDCSGLYTSFLYCYEDLNSGWCGSNGGKCGGKGYCGVPEVSSTLVLAGLAALSMVGFKKMVRS